MILIDPDLDPDAAPRKIAVLPLAVRPRLSAVPWPQRIPTKPTLARFLTEAQQAVRLLGEVNVLLTTDAAIKKLNRQFRGKNRPTDVLSFPAEGIGAEEIAGDLAISVETARRQATDQGHALTCELKVLILHGLLHLAGQDHETDNGKMARREQKLRAALRLPQGLIERAAAPAPSTKKSGQRTAALKGHGFSRADHSLGKGAALAAEGMRVSERALPQGLKPDLSLGDSSARLKPRPFKAAIKTKPGAPSIPQPHAEWVGNHKSQPRKASPTAGGRP
jgi:probable rRNA maturation factor